MIELCEVYKIYRPGSEEVRALDGISLAISSGEFAAIIGPSGSGKSTLMHILGCLDTADYGTYYLGGQPVEYYTANELAHIRNQQIGFVFQSFNLIGRMSIEENVELPLIYRGIKAGRRRKMVAEALERVGLTDRRRHTPNSISGGQQQRAAIARALVTDPDIILGDEPTGNLDSRTSREILSLLKQLNELGKTIVLITHDNDVAAQTRRVIRLMDGRVVEDDAK
jgi:putative ABC transport system ATP-binding protein